MPGEETREDLLKAKDLYDSGRLQEARSVLEQAVSATPRDTRALNFLAYLHYRLGELERARDTYRRLTGLEPGNLTVWSNLGLVSFRLGHFEEARQCFEEYLGHRPEDPKVLNYMGLVMARLGRPGAARTYQERAQAGSAEAAGTAPAAEAAPSPGEAAPPAPSPEKAASRRDRDPMRDDSLPLSAWFEAFEQESASSATRCRTLSSHLVSLRLENRIYFSLPALVMYRGIVLFDQGPNPYGKIPKPYRSDPLVLMSAEGNGRIWLTHGAGWLAPVLLDQDALVVNAHHLVAFEATLECEWLPLGRERHLPGLSALRLSGVGRVVLAAGEGLVSVRTETGTPLLAVPQRLVAWTPGLEPETDRGEELKKVKSFFESPFLRLEGAGRVLLSGNTRGASF